MRVLWLHSAAWIAFETLVALQLKVVGQRPLELEVAGSRVAVTSVAVSAVRRVVKCILVVLLGEVEMDVVESESMEWKEQLGRDLPLLIGSRDALKCGRRLFARSV